MAEDDPRRGLRGPRRRLGPGVPPPRERDRADRGRARAAAGADLDAQRHGRDGRREDGQVRRATSACCTARWTSSGREALLMWLVGAHYRKPIAFSEDALAAGRRRGRPHAGAGPAAATPAPTARGPGRRSSSASSTRWPTTSTPRRRGRRCSTGCARRTGASTPASAWGPGASREMLEAFGLERLLEAEDEAAGGDRASWPREREQARAAATSRAPTGCATSWPSAAGRSATPPTGPRLRALARDRLRPQSRARGAAGTARAVHRVWATESAAPRCWLRRRGVAGRRAAARSSERCGSPDHQGVCAEARPTRTPTPTRCSSAEDALVICLDEVQDPHNLGAVCRVAEAAGCAGLVVPERRSAEVTPAVCKASAGAVEHLPIARVRNLADWLGAAKQARRLGLRRRRPTPPCPTTSPTTAGGSCWCWDPRGAGCARGWPTACDERVVAARSRARSGSLNVSAPRPRRWCTGSCTSRRSPLTRAP